jgi:hypothetical protein
LVHGFGICVCDVFFQFFFPPHLHFVCFFLLLSEKRSDCWRSASSWKGRKGRGSCCCWRIEIRLFLGVCIPR